VRFFDPWSFLSWHTDQASKAAKPANLPLRSAIDRRPVSSISGFSNSPSSSTPSPLNAADSSGDTPKLLLNRLAAAVAEVVSGVASAPLPAHLTSPELLAKVCVMRLDDFAGAGLLVTLWSEVLQDRLIFASDNAQVDPGELRPVYRAHELRMLPTLTDPSELRRLHSVKKMFRGAITRQPALRR
jgi:hypothetical protein